MTDASRNETCSTCKWWALFLGSGKSAKGFCRKTQKVNVSYSYYQRFVEESVMAKAVLPTDHCAKWEQRQEDGQ